MRKRGRGELETRGREGGREEEAHLVSSWVQELCHGWKIRACDPEK